MAGTRTKIMFGLLFILSCVSLSALGQDLTVVVDVPELGKIQGNRANTARDIKPYWVFHGIPYADTASYTGCNRFQPSEVKTDALTEDGSTFLANRLRVICPQNAIFELPESSANDLGAVLAASSKSKRKIMESIRKSKSVEEKKAKVPTYWGQEDCLTVNINTPRIPVEGEPLLPVILFLHGGGSDSIWGSAFTGLRLMEKDVLLLTINYRLGALGAFNLGINEAPGCGALYDAVTALKWIQRYIQHFGGDPNKVTITGQSAGAMMVTHLLLSPLAKDLFHGVWGFSGSALNVWATTPHPSIHHHLDVAHYAGCYDRESQADNPDLKAIADCMAGLDIQEIITASNLYEEQETSAGRLGYDGKGPASIQSPTLTHPKFLVEDPLEILRQQKQHPVPLVLGATRHDGSFPLDDIYNKYLLPSGQLENATYVQNVMLTELMRTFGVQDDAGGLYQTMARTYMGDAANSGNFDDKIPGLIDIATVFGYKGGQYRMIASHAKIQPKSYFYSFDYKGRWTLYNILWGFDKKIPGGICHTDDMMYIFYLLPLFNDDMKVSRRLVDYFVNFATYGDPNGQGSNPGMVEWPAYDEVDHTFLIMNRKDKIGTQCPDTWIGASLELVQPAGISTLEAVEAATSWKIGSTATNSVRNGRTDWGVSSNFPAIFNFPCETSTDSTTMGTTTTTQGTTTTTLQTTTTTQGTTTTTTQGTTTTTTQGTTTTTTQGTTTTTTTQGTQPTTTTQGTQPTSTTQGTQPTTTTSQGTQPTTTTTQETIRTTTPNINTADSFRTSLTLTAISTVLVGMFATNIMQ